jgi:molecular chaperone DnaK
VERNTTIPVEKENVFSTAADNQTAVTVVVYQGERPMAGDNRLLGQFNLEGIPPAPRGVPQIEVKFDIDANGILNVSAKDLGTGKEASVRIEQSSGLDEAEIERRRKDAEQYASEDKRRRELAEARNQAEHTCYQLEKTIKENADKLTDADRQPLERAMEKVRVRAKAEDVAEIKSALEELEQAFHGLSKTIYEKAASQAAGATTDEPRRGSSSGDDDAIDADFEVKRSA